MSNNPALLMRSRAPANLVSWLLRWEVMLLGLLALVVLANSFASPYFLDPYNLADSTFNFSEKAIIALPMALLILCREIDLSVAATIALASVAMGFANQAGADPWMLVVVGLAVGGLAGVGNGLIVTRFGIPSIVVTIGTMSLFRGVAYVVLGDKAFTGYPRSLSWLGQGYIGGLIPVEFVLFLVLAVVFALVLHGTVWGRRLYAIGNNPVAARFSGVDVDRYRLVLFTVTGLLAGLAAVLLTTRIGSTRPNIAMGWELDAVTMVVLGGVAIQGGVGSIVGVVLAVFVLGMATFGMALLNVPGIVMTIFVGLLLILSLALPIVIARLRGTR
jgi:rhamnose transport system permease protein